MSSNTIKERALNLLRNLPRVTISNIRDNPGSKITVCIYYLLYMANFLINYVITSVFVLFYQQKRGRGQHGGDKHGAGNKGSGQRQNYMRPGYETGNNPFYLRFPYEPYYKGHQ